MMQLFFEEKNEHEVTLDMAARNSSDFSEFLPHFYGNPLNVNDQNNVMLGFPTVAAIADESLLDNQYSITLRDVSHIGTSSPMGEAGNQDLLPGGTPVFASSLAASLASRIGLQEHLEKSAILHLPVYPSESLGLYVSNDCYQNLLNPAHESFVDCRYGELATNSSWNTDNFQTSSELGKITAYRTGYLTTPRNLIPNIWLPTDYADLNLEHHDSASKFSNELSLSLSTSQPNVVGRMNAVDQISEGSCSDTTLHCFNATRPNLEVCYSKRLSAVSGANKQTEFSQVIMGSRYLSTIQEILAQIAKYSFNLDQLHGSASKSSSSRMRGNANPGLEIRIDSRLRSPVVEAQNIQLLTLLQLIDERYNQCLDEIHTVVSSFHAATELDPGVHAHFALQTISQLYKNMRERINNHILAAGSNLDNSCTKQRDEPLESLYIQKQWALQKLKRKDHQIWRPQRGLPEKSVSVLRAWMFKNFLHPYPKEAEKHLLAVKSELTISQVSNWFINARVRLWKPMIEAMCAEMNRRQACENDEGAESNLQTPTSTGEQRFSIDSSYRVNSG